MTATAPARWRAHPHLRIAPEPSEILRAEITELAAQIDRRLGNPPGTAERGIYFWYWPRVDDLDVLTALHADAARFLLDTIKENRP
ncbi:hypothetical protein [Mycolicibacterium sp.]|uniref:hypothetical protein n=1 Tax=Mycolicibacterium sp. TaxID=2320850 RepID=UPI001DC1C29F|nr:hypothetical protein [Mycolicibacterium sp.]MCB1290350.1 hypothetical protein [Mycobacterium sp.]MCB9408323.1 hypothetical protein [Mycolicibacterium sp.]